MDIPNKIDPRASRTRELIINAFNQLITTKEFEHISVKDITMLATINRATFYAHFVDKYDLLDHMITKNVTDAMKKHLSCTIEPNEQTVKSMFYTISEVHELMNSRCRKGYNTFTQMIEDKLKEQLSRLIHKSLPQIEPLQATLLSWSLYGAFEDWDHTRIRSLESFAQQAAPYLLRLLQPSS